MAVDACPSARWTVTVRLDRGATRNGSGSETTCAPTGMTVPGRPLKVTGRSVPGSMPLAPALPSAGSATDAEVMGSAAPPKALENRRRIRPPPTETRTVWRRVASANTLFSPVNGGGGMLCGSVSCGIDVQVCTQRPSVTAERPGSLPGRRDPLFTGVTLKKPNPQINDIHLIFLVSGERRRPGTRHASVFPAAFGSPGGRRLRG